MRPIRLAVVLVVLFITGIVLVQDTVFAQQLPTPPPSFKFPWDAGQSKRWTTGPHGSLNYGYGQYQGWNQVYALDFAGSFDVLAMQAGRVIYVNNVAGCGPNGIMLDHGGYWLTEYCHLSKRYAPNGAWIAQGSLLGKTGNVGCGSCGTRLHVSILYSQNGKLNRVYWDDKVIDGWRIHNIYDRNTGKPLYGEGTATREGTSWGWGYGTISDSFVTNKPAKFLIGPLNQTKVSAVKVVSTSGMYTGTTYPASNSSFVSTNQRK